MSTQKATRGPASMPPEMAEPEMIETNAPDIVEDAAAKSNPVDISDGPIYEPYESPEVAPEAPAAVQKATPRPDPFPAHSTPPQEAPQAPLAAPADQEATAPPAVAAVASPSLIKVKTISVVYDRKMSDGNYGSVELGATAWADIEEGVSPEMALQELRQLVRQSVKEQAEELGVTRLQANRNGQRPA